MLLFWGHLSKPQPPPPACFACSQKHQTRPLDSDEYAHPGHPPPALRGSQLEGMRTGMPDLGLQGQVRGRRRPDRLVGNEGRGP